MWLVMLSVLGRNNVTALVHVSARKDDGQNIYPTYIEVIIFITLSISLHSLLHTSQSEVLLPFRMSTVS